MALASFRNAAPFIVYGSWFIAHGSSLMVQCHDLEGYFESPAPQGFQNNLFLVLGTKKWG